MIFGQDTVTYYNGDGAVYIARYDVNGYPIWGKCQTGNGSSIARGIATDGFGNVYVTGYYYTNSCILFGNDTLISHDGDTATDIFIVKYDSSGNEIWAKSYGGASYDIAYSITADNSGNIFVTGIFQSTLISFDSFTLTNIAYQDAFIVKLDSSGNVLWANNGNGNVSSGAYNITSDLAGNAYISGAFTSGQLIFGNYTLFNPVGEDAFLVKFSPNGNVVWAKQAIGTGNQSAYSVITNSFGKVIMTGWFDSSAISFGNYTLNPSSLNNLFLVQYDSSGTVDWARASNGGSCNGYSVITDECGNIFVAGQMHSSPLSFDSINLVSQINNDNIFIMQFCSTGQAILGTTLTFGGDDLMALSTDENNNIYLGGDFWSSPAIIGTDTMISVLGEMPFVAKLNYTCGESCVTGIPQISPQPTISLFPNPFSTSATLLINGELKENSYLYIYNLLGEEVKTIPIINQKEITINRDNLADGMYFYKIIGKNKEAIATGKMVVE